MGSHVTRDQKFIRANYRGKWPPSWARVIAALLNRQQWERHGSLKVYHVIQLFIGRTHKSPQSLSVQVSVWIGKILNVDSAWRLILDKQSLTRCFTRRAPKLYNVTSVILRTQNSTGSVRCCGSDGEYGGRERCSSSIAKARTFLIGRTTCGGIGSNEGKM